MSNIYKYNKQMQEYMKDLIELKKKYKNKIYNSDIEAKYNLELFEIECKYEKSIPNCEIRKKNFFNNFKEVKERKTNQIKIKEQELNIFKEELDNFKEELNLMEQYENEVMDGKNNDEMESKNAVQKDFGPENVNDKKE